jgi:hypothetical protein
MSNDEITESGKKKFTEPDIEAVKALFKITLETRNFEINQLVQRNNFFMIFQGVLFAGLIQSSHTKPVVSFLVCVTGLIVSLFHVRMAAGAKFWQEYWEESLLRIEGMLRHQIHTSALDRKLIVTLFHSDFTVHENFVKKRLSSRGCNWINSLILKRYSVSRIPIYVAISISIIWGLLALCTLREYPPFGIPGFIVGF